MTRVDVAQRPAVRTPGRTRTRPGHRRLEGRRFAFVSPLDFILSRFRLDLMRRLVEEGATVFAVAPSAPDELDWAGHGIRKRYYRESRGSLGPMGALRTVRDLRTVLTDVRPDLVHTFALSANAWGALAARSLDVDRIVNTVTGLGSSLLASSNTRRARMRSRVVGLACRSGARLAREVVFENPDDLAFFRRRKWLEDDRGTVVPGAGVDVDHFRRERVTDERIRSLREASGLPDGLPIVIMVARLLGDKGVREYVEAARSLGSDRASFLLLGSPDPGNPTSLSPPELARLGSGSPVHFLGWRTDVREWLAASDLFVLPSYGEGLPRSSLEAMAMGLPIVTTRAPGCRDTVSDGETGWLVPVGDVRQLAARIGDLLARPEQRTSMGRASRRRVVERFSSERVVGLYLALYERLLESPA